MKIKPGSIKARTHRTFLYRALYVLAACVLAVVLHSNIFAQEKKPMVRIAKIVVDSAQLENYKAALKEGIETAVRVEPGVLSLSAVYDKDNPTHVTVFEVYADEEAYKTHIQTPHFIKYKTTTMHMVKHLELVDVIPIAMAAKAKE